MICPGCNIEMMKREFSSQQVLYCPICSDYRIKENECQHDLILVIFRLSNGGSQLRNYCRKCHYREPNPLKQSEYDLKDVPVRDNEKYNEFYSSLFNGEAEEIRKFTAPLKEKQHYHRYRVYSDYITSDEWREKSRKIQAMYGHKCQICGNPSNHTHHLTYAHFKNEYEFELVALCESCHMEEYHSPKIKKEIESLEIPPKH